MKPPRNTLTYIFWFVELISFLSSSEEMIFVSVFILLLFSKMLAGLLYTPIPPIAFYQSSDLKNVLPLLLIPVLSLLVPN